MLAQLLKPFRGNCNRLIATSVGTKSAGDSEQLHLVPFSDTNFVEPELNILSSTKGEEDKPKFMRGFSRWLSKAKSVGAKLAIENEPLNMVAPGDNTFYIPDRCATPDGFSDHGVELPVPGPMQDVFSNPNSRPPWVDMQLYQAPVAQYHPVEAVAQQAPVGQFPAAAVLMQTVMVPVFYPYAALQMPVAMEAIPITAEEPQVNVFADDADAEQMDAAVDRPQGPRHRRSRRGGAAMRKKLAAQAEKQQALQASQEPCDGDGKHDAQSLSTEAGSPKSADVDSTADGSVSFGNILEEPAREAASAEDAPVDASERIDPMLGELESPDAETRQFALDWVSKSFWPLALTKRGCRILQKALDVGTPVYQQQLLEHMHGQVREAMQSPHANHVLQKFVEIMPPERIQFVLAELQDQVLQVARHRFGCRILQRLIEHCAPEQTEQVIDKVLTDAASLSRHQYGNYVLQHILQHGSSTQRSTIAQVVEQDIIRLSKHRVASHVVSSAMVHCPVEDVQRLTQAVLHDSGQLAELSRREYGSFVVREVNRAARLLRDEQ